MDRNIYIVIATIRSTFIRNTCIGSIYSINIWIIYARIEVIYTRDICIRDILLKVFR